VNGVRGPVAADDRSPGPTESVRIHPAIVWSRRMSIGFKELIWKRLCGQFVRLDLGD
jgi:hypothetical protein